MIPRALIETFERASPGASNRHRSAIDNPEDLRVLFTAGLAISAGLAGIVFRHLASRG